MRYWSRSCVKAVTLGAKERAKARRQRSSRITDHERHRERHRLGRERGGAPVAPDAMTERAEAHERWHPPIHHSEVRQLRDPKFTEHAADAAPPHRAPPRGVRACRRCWSIRARRRAASRAAVCVARVAAGEHEPAPSGCAAQALPSGHCAHVGRRARPASGTSPSRPKLTEAQPRRGVEHEAMIEACGASR
jgi:hypothetical protein